MLDRLKEYWHSSRIIRTAIDSYPDGICFADVDGRPILVNKTFNTLCYELTGQSVTNALAMWDTLAKRQLEPASPDILVLPMKNGTIWQFQRRHLSLRRRTVIQYEAADITELYHYCQRLEENNAAVSRMHERQQELLQSIVANNLDKELLRAKMRIHDQFGRLLIMTGNALKNPQSQETETELFAGWKEAVSDMENAAVLGDATELCPQKELVQVADLIGCHVCFIGKQPSRRKPLLLLYAAIREALTNAVRHAHANRLTVAIKDTPAGYAVRIDSNGTPMQGALQEEGGLGNLRRRLEQEGATLDYDCQGPLALLLQLPKE